MLRSVSLLSSHLQLMHRTHVRLVLALGGQRGVPLEDAPTETVVHEQALQAIGGRGEEGGGEQRDTESGVRT